MLRGVADLPARWLDRVQPSSDLVLFGTALVVGICAGLGAVFFRYLIGAFSWFGFTWLPVVLSPLGRSYVVAVPAAGGLLVGLLVYFLAREAKGHGVPEVMEAVALKGGRIRPVVAVVKSFASAICIGSGGSVGREGPIVQIGSSLGSSVGQALKLSDARVKNLVACGAAGGIAATFNAPIAGVMFALEVILGEFSVRYLSTVVVASVAASVIGRSVFGDAPAFSIPSQYGVAHVWEYGFYIVLGVLAAVGGVIFVRMLYGFEDVFDNWGAVPEWLKPAVGGTLLGLMALAYPQVTPVSWQRMPQIYNVGYEVMQGVLSNQFTFVVLAALLILKLLATSLTLGSGGSGGVFAPALFMGAMMGAAFERAIAAALPGATSPPGAYALVGMAAFFAAAAHAPITAFLILFELTGDYGLIMPLMLTVVVATIVSRRILGDESIYTLKLTRRGVRLQAGRDVDVIEGVTVAEAMSADIDALPMNTTLAQMADAMARRRRLGFPVVDSDGRLRGIVTAVDLENATNRNMPRTTTVGEIATKPPRLLVAFPDETVGDALSRMGPRGVGRLPVVAREDPERLLGVIRRNDIIRAYVMALSRRSELQHRMGRMSDRQVEDTRFAEVNIPPDGAAVGRSVLDMAQSTPYEWVAVSIRRDGRVVIPHGDTVFEAHDDVTAFLRSGDAADLRVHLTGANTAPTSRSRTAPPSAGKPGAGNPGE